MTLHDRLRELRILSGKSQTEFANIGKVSLRSQQQYEKGEVPINSNYLAHIAEAGYDIAFLLTGERNKENLGKPESHLLSIWHAASKERRILAWLALTADTDSIPGWVMGESRDKIKTANRSLPADLFNRLHESKRNTSK